MQEDRTASGYALTSVGRNSPRVPLMVTTRIRGRRRSGSRACGSRPVVAQGVGQASGRDGQPRLREGHGGLAEHRLEPDAGPAVARGVVRDDGRVGGVDRAHPVEHRGEGGGHVTDQLCQALDVDEPAIARRLHAGDEPLFVPDLDNGAGGNRELFDLLIHCRGHVQGLPVASGAGGDGGRAGRVASCGAGARNRAYQWAVILPKLTERGTCTRTFPASPTAVPGQGTVVLWPYAHRLTMAGSLVTVSAWLGVQDMIGMEVPADASNRRR